MLFFFEVLSGTNLYVGYSSKSNSFATIQKAVNKAASINPTSESAHITIHIAPGKYREQVIVQTPYITFINDETSKGTVTITCIIVYNINIIVQIQMAIKIHP